MCWINTRDLRHVFSRNLNELQTSCLWEEENDPLLPSLRTFLLAPLQGRRQCDLDDSQKHSVPLNKHMQMFGPFRKDTRKGTTGILRAKSRNVKIPAAHKMVLSNEELPQIKCQSYSIGKPLDKNIDWTVFSSPNSLIRC